MVVAQMLSTTEEQNRFMHEQQHMFSYRKLLQKRCMQGPKWLGG
jgi:hypothetical protein